MTMTDTTTNTVEEAKQRARAEIEQYRERRRVEREARDRANESAEAEIERTIRQRREDEAKQAELRAALDRFWVKREADLAAQAAAEREAPRRIMGVGSAPPPARRVAQLLRKRLGDDFDSFVADIRGCDWRQLKIEIDRIPHDELAERLHREREAQAAEMAEAARTLPDPEDDVEAAIMDRHGFLTAVRAAELDAGAL